MTRSTRAADPSELRAASRVLAEAFADYPWTRWALPAEDYVRRLEEVQHLYLRHAWEHGLVIVDDDLHAVAAFLPPDTPPPAGEILQRVAEAHGPRLAALERLRLPLAPRGSWTLQAAAVRPDRQGEGRGTAVIVRGPAVIDGRGAPVALETSDERNVRLYERLGFMLTAETPIPGGPMVWSMTRAGSTAEPAS